MLNNRHHGNRKEAARESQNSNQKRSSEEVRAARKEKGKDGHTGGAQWDESVFNLSARQIAGGHAAQADSDSDGGEQVSGPVRPTLEYLTSVIVHGVLEQRGEHEKVRDAETARNRVRSLRIASILRGVR
jgi:hypothetical protein